MTKNIFDPESLVTAIKDLFESNNYVVDGPLKINGAEVDLRASSKTDPFAPAIYIEATVEYVDNTKYGKDATKFLLIRELEPNVTLLCVSASGFSLPVKERAKKSRIGTFTYEELFARFQRFGGYLNKVLGSGELAQELSTLNLVYEEARFKDALGDHRATEFLSNWRKQPKPQNPWIIVVGDYGTGKTALSKVLLHRWMTEYLQNPQHSIPFRIELRDFSRQFDARGLLHHFLDTNELAHISVDFVVSLIKQGRVILLLDGYDEMAQYMNARERRECLGALAELAKDGAKGILTSRPNYFTEAEELNLLDALYTSLAEEKRLSGIGHSIIEKEKALDTLLQGQFIERYERFLQDLDEEQTKSLVQKSLSEDPEGQNAVMRILERTFRSTDEGAAVSLSGKPVIISYLLQVVEELKTGVAISKGHSQETSLTEWQVYDLIVDNLMWRDYRRTPEIAPSTRRAFLRHLSLHVSSNQTASVDEKEFIELIRKEFQSRLRSLSPEIKEQEIQKLFGDLRASSTLTRLIGYDDSGWRFSHNSLREFLTAEYLVSGLGKMETKIQRIRVTDAMRMFVSSLSDSDHERLLLSLKELITSGNVGEVIGMYLSLMWDAGLRLFQGNPDPVNSLISRISNRPISLSEVAINRISFNYNNISTNLAAVNFMNSSMTDIDFSRSNLEGANFNSSLLEGVSFKGANLSGSSFQGAMLIEVDFTDANLSDTDFHNIADHTGIRTSTGVYNGEDALGYFAFKGGRTDKVKAIAICKHHPHYPVAEKIARKLSEQTARQIRGLTQRGSANKDPKTARDFLDQLISHGIVEEIGGRNALVQSTPQGRTILKAFCDGDRLDPSLYKFFGITT
jgi:hypothetical protein